MIGRPDMRVVATHLLLGFGSRIRPCARGYPYHVKGLLRRATAKVDHVTRRWDGRALPRAEGTATFRGLYRAMTWFLRSTGGGLAIGSPTLPPGYPPAVAMPTLEELGLAKEQVRPAAQTRREPEQPE